MEPFALLKMMGIFVTGGITGRIVLYLLLLAVGVGVRCALQRRRDFWTAAGISAGLWLVCEIIVDIGSVHEMSVGLFSAAATLGALGFSFALGLGLAALVCRLLRRKQLGSPKARRPRGELPAGALSIFRRAVNSAAARARPTAPAAGSARHSRRRTP